jgi:hypothetical protein
MQRRGPFKAPPNSKKPRTSEAIIELWERGQDLNLRPSGYEPDELPGCSTPAPATLISGRDDVVTARLRHQGLIRLLPLPTGIES